MTREKAIKILKPMLDSFVDYANLTMKVEDDNTVDALDMAIEALKQPEIIRCGECKYYKIDHPKANGYHCCYRCHNIFPMKETDFCSKAEMRTDG